MNYNLNDKNFINELFQECLKAQTYSYSPYSNYRVGAVIYTKDGHKIHGANIENSSYGLCNCAERTALFSSRMEGYEAEDLALLALVADSKGKDYASPCGACRQVMSELMESDAPIIMFNRQGEYIVSKVKDLLPGGFKKEDLI